MRLQRMRDPDSVVTVAFICVCSLQPVPSITVNCHAVGVLTVTSRTAVCYQRVPVVQRSVVAVELRCGTSKARENGGTTGGM